MNFYGIEDIHQLTGMQLDICLSMRDSLLKAIQYYYTEVEARQAAQVANKSFEDQDMEEIEIEEEGDSDTPVINLLSRLINRAHSTNASDIHIEPFEHKTLVRMRIDGVIVEYVTLQKSLHASLIARIKILGEMDIAERRIPAGRPFPPARGGRVYQHPCVGDPYGIRGKGGAAPSEQQCAYRLSVYVWHGRAGLLKTEEDAAVSERHYLFYRPDRIPERQRRSI